MDRILVVEDDKILAKLLAKKIEIKLQFEVDVAHSLQEARLFIKKYKYFLALLDLNLPDAPYGEVVDIMLGKKIPSLVLSGILDKDVRTTILQKDIIDYIKKGTIEEIRYIVSAVERLHKNRAHKVLIVDDSLLFRNQMKTMVEHLFFKVITVAHGEEALEILKTNPDIKIVLTDYNMPVMNGLELTKNIRKMYSKNELSIIAISSDHAGETSALFLKNGATDYIHKPFSKEEFSCRLNNAIEALENILTITHNANRDFLTGLYNRRYFFDNMLKYFTTAKSMGENFCIGMIDIDNFKSINDTYGHDTGDDVIVYLSEILTRNTDTKDIVARFGGEEFCIVFKDIPPDIAIQRCETIRTKAAKSNITDYHITFTVSIGLTLVMGDNLNEMINSADMLLYKAKNSGKNRLEILRT
jgi:diguanylate cyclase (GGDEF)-like protein